MPDIEAQSCSVRFSHLHEKVLVVTLYTCVRLVGKRAVNVDRLEAIEVEFEVEGISETSKDVELVG